MTYDDTVPQLRLKRACYAGESFVVSHILRSTKLNFQQQSAQQMDLEADRASTSNVCIIPNAGAPQNMNVDLEHNFYGGGTMVTDLVQIALELALLL